MPNTESAHTPDIYADIRPYGDADVAAVLQRLLRSPDLFAALLRFRFPGKPAWYYRWLSPLLRWYLQRQARSIQTVDDFQRWLAPLIAMLLERSSQQIEVRGLEHLTPGTPYLFISNHRDIAMDPTLINYSLHRAGWPTSRIAIGDNLLSHPDVADIMRLNKSFVVKRSFANNREKLRELQKLSGYIRQSLDEGVSIWIAQREGRAKDGVDETDTAVLKMLALNGRERGEDFTRTLTQMRPVPVCIQYEWDPCDVLKANELVTLANNGRYDKAPGEDTRSILLGMTGQKGRIIVDFGRPLAGVELSSADQMAQAIDQQLELMREILPVQRTALALLQRDFSGYEQYPGAEWHSEVATQLEQRLQPLEAPVRQRLLQTYAMPLLVARAFSSAGSAVH